MNIVSLTDEPVAQMVRADGIDILVDLSGHTGGNRLLVFARKPAPIQVTYLAYPNTTGMNAIDYRFTDALADPPGMTDHLNAEKLWRLPACNWCFQPPDNAPEIRPREDGPIAFGCFNAFSKINAKLTAIWSDLLKRVPSSRLLLKSTGAGEASSRQRLTGQFAGHGIPEERIEMLGWTADARTHLELYHRIDVALDTYPYHGTTTTCEALWMGVPVVTMAGQTHVSRVGVSLLSNVGLAELIAQSPEEYVSIAVELTGDLPRLAEIAPHHAFADAGVYPDGCTPICPKYRSRLPPNVADVVCGRSHLTPPLGHFRQNRLDIRQRSGKIRTNCQRLPERGQRLLLPTRAFQHNPQHIARIGIALSDHQRSPIRRAGFFRHAGRSKRVTQSDRGIHRIRRQRQRLPERFHRFIEASDFQQDRSQVGVIFRDLRIDGDCPGKQFHRPP